MKSSSGNALNLVNGYISAFGQYGLDTSSLTKAVQDLNWAQGQVPMLSRRQSMAQAVANEHPGMTTTAIGAGALDYATNAQAAAAGKQAGQQALQELESHESDQEILAELQKSGDDPSYVAAFFQALGPQGLTALGIQVTSYQQGGQKSEYTQWSQAVGNAFGVATFSMPYNNDFLENLHPPQDIEADPTYPELSFIAPFLDQGVVSPTWLKPLGQYALTTAYAQGQAPGMSTPIDLDPIWTAIANNSSFAAQYYSQNFNNKQNPNESLSGLMTNPMTENSIGDAAFAAMVKSATVPPGYAAQAGQIGPWAANAQLTVQYFGGSSGVGTSGDIKQSLGEIAMFYFNDMYDTVGAAAPGIGENGKNVPGFNVTASSSDWTNFMNEVMSDKVSSAQFLTFYSQWRSQFQDNLSPWQNEQFQLMDNLVVQAYQNNHQPAGSDPSEISDIVAAAGSSFLTSLAFGPEAGVADALLDGAKDGFQTTVENTISSAFDGGGGLSDPATPESIQQITGAAQNWERIVRNWYNVLGGQPATGVTFGGSKTPIDGSPQNYINQYGGASANFLDSNGKILPLSEIQSHPAQLAAYNAWLQSGAISEATIPGINVPGQPAKTLGSDLPQQASSAGSG
ncbi:MAG TPA: DUF6571 family protein [Streptosporangiaceae bacterium]